MKKAGMGAGFSVCCFYRLNVPTCQEGSFQDFSRLDDLHDLLCAGSGLHSFGLK
jgi:hypothetical protein